MSSKTKQVTERAHRHRSDKTKSSRETPLAKVKRLHGSKESLIDALAADLARESGDSKDELTARLTGAPNTKLLRLHAAMASVREKYGSKDKLIQAISKARGHGKDQDYAAKLQSYSIPRLLDMARSAS
jgi:hypothetical protein